MSANLRDRMHFFVDLKKGENAHNSEYYLKPIDKTN